MESATAPASDPSPGAPAQATASTAPAAQVAPAVQVASARRRPISPATLTRISEAAAAAAIEVFYGAERAAGDGRGTATG